MSGISFSCCVDFFATFYCIRRAHLRSAQPRRRRVRVRSGSFRLVLSHTLRFCSMTGASSASAHKVRAHGFSSPTNAFQIASWVLYVFFVALFYAVLFLYPTPAGAQAGWGVAFGIMAAITALAAVWATAVDPADVALREPAPQAGAAHAAGGAFCYYCERNVHESSKHCVECWKCVLLRNVVTR